MLIALLIAAALYFGYFGWPNVGGERARGVTAIDASRSVACRTQRQQIERDLIAWEVDHPDDPPTIAALEASGVRVPACPEGGRYAVSGRSVTCSVHR